MSLVEKHCPFCGDYIVCSKNQMLLKDACQTHMKVCASNNRNDHKQCDYCNLWISAKFMDTHQSDIRLCSASLSAKPKLTDNTMCSASSSCSSSSNKMEKSLNLHSSSIIMESEVPGEYDGYGHSMMDEDFNDTFDDFEE